MKKILLSLFCSLMIGVTCFAPLTVSANEKIENVSNGQFNNSDYSLFYHNDGNPGTSINGKFKYFFLLPEQVSETGHNNYFSNGLNISAGSQYDIEYFYLHFHLPEYLPINSYTDIYIDLYLDNIDISDLTINRLSHSNFSFIDPSYYSMSKSDNKLTIHLNDLNISTQNFILYFTKTKTIDNDKTSNIYITGLRVYNADSLEKLAKLQEDPMKDFLNNVGNIFNECMNWVDSLIEIIVTTPILLLTTGFLCLGAAVGLFVRFIYKD